GPSLRRAPQQRASLRRLPRGATLRDSRQGPTGASRSGRADVVTIAALPMYDLPELVGETDALWSAIAESLRASGVRDVPRTLTRDRSPAELLVDPELLLAQTCGYPLTHEVGDALTVVATPSYRAPGCEGSGYRSLVVVA